jgi:RimJ/RimL family protein N-acetyltransferase
MARLPKKQPSFSTKRLRLRKFRAGDVDAMQFLYSDAENLRYGSGPSGRVERTNQS